MKAIFFFNEMYMGSQTVAEARPEILFPVSRSLSGMAGSFSTSPPFPTPSEDKTFIRLSFRLVDRGREYAIYKFNGFED